MVINSPIENSAINDSKELFLTFSNLILIIAVYLYFMGWVYIYFLFTHFGISMITLDIPFHYIFLYSISVVNDWKTILVIIGAILLLCFAFKSKSKFKALIMCSSLVFLFFVFFYISKSIAIDEATRIRTGFSKRIILTLKRNSETKYPGMFLKANKEGKLKLLFQTKDNYFVIYQVAGEKECIPFGYTFDIPRADILLVKIEMQDISK